MFTEKEHFSILLGSMKATLKEEKIHEANRTLLHQQIKALWDVIEPEHPVRSWLSFYKCTKTNVINIKPYSGISVNSNPNMGERYNTESVFYQQSTPKAFFCHVSNVLRRNSPNHCSKFSGARSQGLNLSTSACEAEAIGTRTTWSNYYDDVNLSSFTATQQNLLLLLLSYPLGI